MIYLGADHRGYNLKEKIKTWLKEWGREFEDLGNAKYDPEDDYPDYAWAVATRIKEQESKRIEGEKNLGIVICGSGVGVDIAANKVKGVLCGLGYEEKQIEVAVKHDGINILALASGFLDDEKAKKLVRVFIESRFDGEERHQRRIDKIQNYEAA